MTPEPESLAVRQAQDSGAPPLRVALQTTVSVAVGEDGEQLTASITGACRAPTVRVMESLSLPAALVTVSETA